jgi:uncharacterized protein YjiS (DUF1127 family)
MLVYVNGKEAEIGATWVRRRNNIDIYLDAAETAVRFVWAKLRDMHEKRQASLSARGMCYLDDRTLSDIGISRTDVGHLISGTGAVVHTGNHLPLAGDQAFGKRAFDRTGS